MSTQAKGTHLVHSGWDSGKLVFYEKAYGHTTTGDIFEIGTTQIQVGDTAQDVDLLIYLGNSGSSYVKFDAGASTMTVAGVDVTVTGDLTLDTEDINLGDGDDLEFGDSQDVLMRWSTADASNHAFVLALDDTAQQMHITDKGAVATDWNRSAGTHPELSIHSNTTPATDYMAIGNHDGTTAHIDVVGGTTLSLDIAGTAEVLVTADATYPATSNSNALGTTSNMWSDLFLASGGVINFNNGDITITHGTNKTLDIASTWSSASVADEMFAVVLTTNVSLGSYANAFFAKVDCQTVGGATGLLSAGCFEVMSPTTGIAGTTAGIEIEMGYGATCGALQKPCFFYLSTYGTAATDFDTYGDFAKIQGVTAGTGKMLSAGSQTLRVGTGSLAATKKYIVMSNTENSIVMGSTGAPAGDFILWGTTAGYKVTFDVDGDTNGAWYFGADDYGVDVGMYGQTAGISWVWDASAGQSIFTQGALGADARAERHLYTCATPAMTDGYGAHEIDLTVTGTATGAINATSSWVNLGTSAVVPGYLTVHTDGIWDGTATLTNAYISMQKYTCLLASNPAFLSIWELNYQSDANNVIDSMFNVNDAARALGYTEGTSAGNLIGGIPFFSVAGPAGGGPRYIYLYDAPPS